MMQGNKVFKNKNFLFSLKKYVFGFIFPVRDLFNCIIVPMEIVEFWKL